MKSRNKDRKTHESIIGKIIYGFLLFMPLLAIFVTCSYVIFNKNAYQSYSDELIDETNLLNQSNTSTLYIQNQEVTWVYDENKTFNSQSNIFGFKSINLDINELLNTTNVNYVGFRFYTSQFGIMRFIDSNGVERNLQNPLNYFKTFTYVVDLTTYQSNAIYNYGNSYVISYTTQKLDNAFYYSIDKVQESPLFNWAENSAIYTGMSATCNTLNITTPFIPLLMTYWLIISVIYILYDIILVILHIFHKKIHQLEDSF